MKHNSKYTQNNDMPTSFGIVCNQCVNRAVALYPTSGALFNLEYTRVL